jgi:hypothetical protein
VKLAVPAKSAAGAVKVKPPLSAMLTLPPGVGPVLRVAFLQVVETPPLTRRRPLAESTDSGWGKPSVTE